jgi:hypothetical protein
MAITKFGFSFEREDGLEDEIQTIRLIEPLVAKEMSTRVYGANVKHVCIGIILLEPEHIRRPSIRKPVYKPGKYESRRTGVRLQFEDTLEFEIRPSLQDIRSATTVCGIVASLQRSLVPALLELQRLKIPEFDMAQFCSDLNHALTSVATANSRGEFAGVGRFGVKEGGSQPIGQVAGFPCNVPNSVIETHAPVEYGIDHFPAEALAFVERELPNVHLAVKQNDRKLLEPILARAREFLDRWGGSSSRRVALEVYPACASLVADVVREGTIELDEQTNSERTRVHEEFKREWEACKTAHAETKERRRCSEAS